MLSGIGKEYDRGGNEADSLLLEIPTLCPQPANSPFHNKSRSIPLLAVHK
ncbi:hypothetical protein HMPREF1990_00974 [Porphyromonas gingivalis W4087]|nr:hypothetical protein HMPREF1553_01689 [Porphyromonas gingivalis F0568]ERJ89278.1 hypothetical protein HMPREF1990_00974 [Porphyromonas gingivalis W4087]